MVYCVHICSILHKQPDKIIIPPLSCFVQRSTAVWIPRVNSGRLLYQEFGYKEVRFSSS